MSYDPGSSSDRADQEPDGFDALCGVCERCGDWVDQSDVSVEAWERLEMIVCPDCAEEEPE